MVLEMHKLKLMEERMKGRKGFSLVELLVVVTIIMVILAIAIPYYSRAKGAGNEAGATAQLATFFKSQTLFQNAYNQGYASTLAQLGGTPGAAPTCAGGQDMDNVSLTGMGGANFKGDAYTFTPTGTAITGAGPCLTSTLTPGWVLVAKPISPANGTRSLCIDENGQTHYDSALSVPITEAGCEALAVLGN